MMGTVDGGASMAAHLRQAAKSGVEVEGLDAEERGHPPLELSYVWSMFLELHNARGSTGFAPAPIGFCEIDAYSRIYGIPLSPFEVDVIRKLDVAWFDCLPKPKDK